MTFARQPMRYLSSLCRGVVVALLLTVTAGVMLAPSSILAAESRPPTVRSDRRLERERSVRLTKDSRPAEQPGTGIVPSRRPRAVRR